MLKGTPRPKGMAPPAPRGSVVDALDALERRRKPAGKATAKPRRGDLDLGSIR